MHKLIAGEARNKAAIFPYIGGEEVNTSPTQEHHRYVINFHDYPLRRADLGETWESAEESQRREWLRSGVVPYDYPEPVAADWPDLLAIVEEKVKPERMLVNRKGEARKMVAIRRSTTSVCKPLSIGDGPSTDDFQSRSASGVLLSAGRDGLRRIPDCLPSQHLCPFCVLQSRPHEIWARLFGSSMKDRPPVHAVRLLRDVSLSRRLGVPRRPRSGRENLL